MNLQHVTFTVTRSAPAPRCVIKRKILIYLFSESGHDWYSLRNTPQETANRIEIARPIFSSNKINKSVNHTKNKGRKIIGNKIQLHISVSAKIVHDKV